MALPGGAGRLLSTCGTVEAGFVTFTRDGETTGGETNKDDEAAVARSAASAASAQAATNPRTAAARATLAESAETAISASIAFIVVAAAAAAAAEAAASAASAFAAAAVAAVSLRLELLFFPRLALGWNSAAGLPVLCRPSSEG